MKVSALLDFEPYLYVSADVLSKEYDVKIGDQTGKLFLPSLPDWAKDEKDPLRRNLIGPTPCKDWEHGWGTPISYPLGESEIHKVYVEFEINIHDDAQKIYNDYSRWRELFYKYIKILTEQHTDNNVQISNESRGISIFEKNDKLNRIKSIQTEHISIDLSSPNRDVFLHYDQLSLALDKASRNINLRIEYHLLLNALEARGKKDYRMAVIDAANSIEICLQSKIKDACKNQNISFGDDLLRKYTMLGGKIELAKLLGILPKKDFTKVLNRSVH